MSDDPVARFRRAYWRAFRELDSVRLRQWEEYRLTLPQLRVLYHIRRTPGVTGGELAAALGITVSTVSGLVGKLTERGLLARGTAPDDRRQAPLELTPEGLALVGTLAETGRDFTAHVAAALGADLAGVTAALERLAVASEGTHAPPVSAVEAAAAKGRAAEAPVGRAHAEAVIVELLPDAAYTVALEDGRHLAASLSGKLRTSFARFKPGDRVVVAPSPGDDSRWQVISRF